MAKLKNEKKQMRSRGCSRLHSSASKDCTPEMEAKEAGKDTNSDSLNASFAANGIDG